MHVCMYVAATLLVSKAIQARHIGFLSLYNYPSNPTHYGSPGKKIRGVGGGCMGEENVPRINIVVVLSTEERSHGAWVSRQLLPSCLMHTLHSPTPSTKSFTRTLITAPRLLLATSSADVPLFHFCAHSKYM